MTRRINLSLDKREAENLNLLLGKYGGKAPAYFRALLKEAFEREFGGYKRKKIMQVLDVPEEQLTDEQFCEKFGGRVMRDSAGTRTCGIRIPGGSSIYSIPLSSRDRIEEIAIQYIKDN